MLTGMHWPSLCLLTSLGAQKLLRWDVGCILLLEALVLRWDEGLLKHGAEAKVISSLSSIAYLGSLFSFALCTSHLASSAYMFIY